MENEPALCTCFTLKRLQSLMVVHVKQNLKKKWPTFCKIMVALKFVTTENRRYCTPLFGRLQRRNIPWTKPPRRSQGNQEKWDGNQSKVRTDFRHRKSLSDYQIFMNVSREAKIQISRPHLIVINCIISYYKMETFLIIS